MLAKFKRNVVDLFVDSVANTLSANLSGTVTVNTTSATVTGVGTAFTSDFKLDDRLFIGSESRQVASITNSTVMVLSSAFSDDYNANTYKKGRLENNNYYVFAARQSPYLSEEITANTIDNDYEASVFLYDEMMFGRKITTSDVIPIIAKRVWSANTKYSPYDDKNTQLSNSAFYVLTSENKVYKCIHNNNNVSTVEPNHTELGYPPEESDSYRWMFLYEINNEDYLTFATENYIPVFENANVKNVAIDGSIFNFVVEANGSSYPADSGLITTTGNNYLIQIDGDSASSNGFFSNCAITITNDSTNLTFVKEIREYVSNTLGNFVALKVPFEDGDVANNQLYSIAPYVKIESKTGSNCVAYCLMQNVSNTTFTGSIDAIEIVNPGKDYKQANVSIQTSPGLGSGALVRAVISPKGGHGFNVKDELFCTSVGVGVQFSNSAVFSHSSDVEFRTVGIIKNPLSGVSSNGAGTISIAANSTIIQGLSTLFTKEINLGDYILYSGEEKEVNFIANDTYLTLESPFSRTVSFEQFKVRKRFSDSHFNQTIFVNATRDTPATLAEGEFVVGSDGAGGGSQVSGKVAYANSSSVVITGIDREETIGNTQATIFLNDVVLTGVGYNVTSAATPTIAASGAKYSKVASNSSNANGAFTTFPDLKLYSGEILYVQNLLPIQRSNTTNEQVRLVIKF